VEWCSVIVGVLSAVAVTKTSLGLGGGVLLFVSLDFMISCGAGTPWKLGTRRNQEAHHIIWLACMN
jgi:hypothetical protein